MYISTKYEFAFLCIPKCASTSIEILIEPLCNIKFSGHPSLKHISVEAYQEHILKLYQNRLPSHRLESFCIMREPLTWINSWYRYQAREELADPGHPNHGRYTGNISYEDFITAYLSPSKRPPYAQISTPFNFLLNKHGKVGIDRLFALERPQAIEEFLSNKLKRPITLPQKNISPKINFELPSELQEQLQNHFRRDSAIYQIALEHGSYNQKYHRKKLTQKLEAKA